MTGGRAVLRWGYEDYLLGDGDANVNVIYSVDADKAYDPLVTAMSSQTLVQICKIYFYLSIFLDIMSPEVIHFSYVLE